MRKSQDMEQKVISAVRDFASSTNSGGKVVADMSVLADVTSQLPLSGMKYWERLIRREFFFALEFESRPGWKFWSKPARFATWIDIISRDGYEREKTLRTLTGAVPNSFFFALALRRLNDWVPQVRQAAREKLPKIADASDPVHVVDALCATLLHWNSWGRMNGPDRQALLNIISKPGVAKALKKRIVSEPLGPMAFIFSQVGRTPVLDADLEYIAQNAVQPAVRAKVYRSLFENKVTWFEGRKWEWIDVRYCKGRFKPIISERELTASSPFEKTMRSASGDPSAMVRRVAAELLIRELESMGDESLRLAHLLASDDSPSVAERGRFALRRLEDR